MYKMLAPCRVHNRTGTGLGAFWHTTQLHMLSCLSSSALLSYCGAAMHRLWSSLTAHSHKYLCPAALSADLQCRALPRLALAVSRFIGQAAWCHPLRIHHSITLACLHQGEGGGAYGAAAGGGEGGEREGYEFGVDPNLDPELAMALRVSLEEERARQVAGGGDPAAPAAAGILVTDLPVATCSVRGI